MISTGNFVSELQSSAVLARLLEATIKGSVILATATLGASLLRNRSAALRHMIWVAASVAAVSVLFLPAVVPEWRVLPAIERPAAIATSSDTPPASTTSEMQVDDGQRVTIRRATLKPEPITTKASSPAEVAANATPNAQVESTPIRQSTVGPQPAVQSPISWAAFTLGIWLFGITFWMGYYLLGTLKVRRLMKHASPVVESDWIRLAENVRDHLQIRRPVSLLCSPETEVPLTFGVIYPKILLPGDSNEWSAQHKNAVIRHEMAHIVRLDAFTQSISQLTCAVYWFNPLAWMAAQRVRFERERACDDYVLAAGSAPSEYANDLLTMVSNFRRSEHYAVALAMARKSQLEGRLVALLNPKLSRQKISRATALWIAAIALAVVLPLAALSPSEPVTQADTKTIQKKPKATAASAAGQAGSATTGDGVEPALAPVADGAAQSDEAQPALAPAAATTYSSGGPNSGIAGGVAGGVRDGVQSGVGVGVGNGVGGGVATGVGGGVEAGYARAPMAAAMAAVSRQKTAVTTPPANRQTGFECQQGHGSSSSNMHESDGLLKSWQVKWTGDGCSMSLDAQGEVTFTDDFTTFQSVSNGGYVDITWRKNGDVRRLSVRPVNGRLEYKWFWNDAAHDFDQEGRKWLADLLIAMDRRSAIGLKQRFPKLMQEGGAKRVLEEVSYMDSDYARSAYLLKLIQDVDLKSDELKSVMARAGEMGSDYECARVLMAVAGKYPLRDGSERAAFVSAIDTLQSDYEHARVLMAFFQKGQVSAELSKTILDSVSRIKSDYEHARVLMAFFESGTIPKERLRGVLQSASQLKSDYEHARVLVQMANRNLVDANTQSDFLASVNGIRSDYEHARTLVAFLGARKSDDAALLGVIQSVPSIKSGYEAARVLGVVASGKRLEGSLRDEYIRAAQSIQSQNDRNQALAAVGYKQASL